MLIDLLLVVLALVMLILGADGLVRGSASLALRAGLPPLVAGLTIVAFGTSAPELVVSVEAVTEGRGDISVGNVVGSNVFNVAVILGLVALLQPLKVHPRIRRLDAPIALGAGVLLALLLLDDRLSGFEGVILLVLLAAYIANSIRLARGAPPEEAGDGEAPSATTHWQLDTLFVAGGLGLLVIGSEILVANALDLARAFGVDEAIIGLTIIAAGTSTPELATSVVAAFRRQADIAIGNVVGSNLFNVLGILGIASLVGELRTSGIGLIDYGMALLTSGLLVGFALRSSRLGRLEGAALLACYGAYIALRWP